MLIGLFVRALAEPPPSCPPMPSYLPAVPVTPTELAADRVEVTPAEAAIAAELAKAIHFQDPYARIEVRSSETTVTAIVNWNVGEGIADCTLTYDRTGLASRACTGQYVAHSMGDANQRFVYSTQERFAGKRVSVTGTLRTTLEKTGAFEDTVLTMQHGPSVVDAYFNPALQLDLALLKHLE